MLISLLIVKGKPFELCLQFIYPNRALLEYILALITKFQIMPFRIQERGKLIIHALCYLWPTTVYVLFITSLFCNILIYLNSVNYSLPTQLFFLPETLTSRVQTLLILESVCVIYCRHVDWWQRYRNSFYSLLTWRKTNPLHSKHYNTVLRIRKTEKLWTVIRKYIMFYSLQLYVT